MSAPAKTLRGSVATLADEQAFRRRRNHAQIEAMTGLILQSVGYPTRRHRDFICALQSTNSGNDSRVPYTPFRRAHLTLADLMMCEGAPDTRRKAVYREIVVLRSFQRRTGVMLFNVTSGSDEEATEYIDYLTPAADASIQRMLSSPLWKTDKQAAKREAVAWAVEQLPRCDVVEEEEDEGAEPPLADFQEERVRKLVELYERDAMKIEQRGGDPYAWTDRLIRELQRVRESLRKTAPARLDHSSLRAVEDVDEAVSGEDGAVLSGNTTGDSSVLPPSDEARDFDERQGADKNVAPSSANSNGSDTYPFTEPSLFDEGRPQTTSKPPTPLDAALSYARRGWPVFPLHHPDPHRGCSCIDAKECRSPGKHPRTRKGLKDATTDERQIRKWWELYPLANVGLAMGRKSGLVAVDVDPRSGGDSSITELIERHGDLPDTLEAITGGGGTHILFAHPGVSFKNSSSVLGEGLDVKTDGGYIVAAPSLHSSGKRYSWRTRRRPSAMPHWLLNLLTTETQKSATPATAEPKSRAPSPAQSGPVIAKGSRNQRLFRIACSMRGNGSGHAEIEAELLEVNSSRCSPPLDADEVRKIAASAAKYPVGR